MAMDFERSSSQFVDIGLDLPVLNAATQATLMGWVKLESAVGTMGWFAWSIGPPPGISSSSRFVLEIRSTRRLQIVVRADDSTNVSNLGTAALTLGVWHHIACVVNIPGDISRIYIDGVEDSNFTPAYGPSAFPSNNSKNAAIGGRADGGSELLDGVTEDVRFYERIVTANEIQTIHTFRGPDGIVPDHRYLLNEGHDGKTATGVGTVKDLGIQRQDAEPKASPVYAAGVIRYRRKAS